jgi:hypothetical protein
MGDYVSLTCRNCGGKLLVSNTIDRFACGYCDNEHIVKRGDGIIFLQPVIEGLQNVQSGVDKTASELAIKRLSKEIITLKAARNEEVDEQQGKYAWGCLAPFLLILPAFACLIFSFSATSDSPGYKWK